ncbi:MAG: MFS transporter [Candidatus Latescibacterota bacterium]
MANKESLKEYYKYDVFAFLLGFGGSVWGGMTYYLGIPVALLAFLGASSFQIGLITAIFWVGFAIPQIWAGYQSEVLTIKKKYIGTVLILSSLGFLVYGFYLLMTSASNPSFAIWFFLLAFAWAAVLGGLYIPANFSLLFKIIPSAKLGQLLGIMFAIQFGGIVISLFAVNKINAAFAAPMNYAVMFILTFIITIICAAIMFMLGEPEGEKVQGTPSLGAYIGKMVDVLKTDKLLVKFLIGKWLMSGTYVMMAFLLIFLIKERGFAGEHGIWFTSFNALGLFIGGFTVTKIADIYGPKQMLITSQIIAVIYTLMAILFPSIGSGLAIAIFIITGIAQISDNVGYTNMCLFCCPTEDKSTYVAVTNVGIIPFMALFPIIMGLLIDKGILSYIGTFTIALIMMVAAIIYLAVVLENPKSFRDMKAAMAQK